MIGVTPFQRHGLPYAGQGTVPALLAERDLGKGGFRIGCRIVGRTFDANLDLVRAVNELFRDLEAKREETALIFPDGNIVHPGAGAVKHAAEAEKGAPVM